jgi:hypothetical protein
MKTPQIHIRMGCLMLLLACWGWGNAHAASLYKIDMLIFLNKASGDLQNEHWPSDIAGPDASDALAIQSPRPAGSAYAQVAASQRRLNAVRYQLERSAAYRPLLHLAWLQPAVNGRAGKKLYFELPDNGGGLPRLRGTIKINRSRYLHAEIDVVYRGQFPPSDASRSGEAVSFRLKETRRMRSNQLHYLDHPAIGALLIATPITLDAEEETEAEDETHATVPPAAPSAPAPEPN